MNRLLTRLLNRLLGAAVLLLLLAGCGITVVPMATSAGTINPKDNSIASNRGNLMVTVRVQDLEIAPYRMEHNITSFYLVIRNATATTLTLPLDAFVLVDNQGNQYRPIEPANIQGMTQRDSEYLIPYPFVGYYYLEDRVQGAFTNTMESSLPFYTENHPQNILLEALPIEPLLPGNRISGLLYFPIDLYTKDSIELRIYRPGSSPNEAPDFIFPFSIKK